MKCREIVIDGVRHVAEDQKVKAQSGYSMVRTYSAGVFAGKIEERNGKEVRMSNARRIWYWQGAASLSELAQRGTSKPDECKFPAPVSEVILTEAIEIIPITEKAYESIYGVSVWSQ